MTMTMKLSLNQKQKITDDDVQPQHKLGCWQLQSLVSVDCKTSLQSTAPDSYPAILDSQYHSITYEYRLITAVSSCFRPLYAISVMNRYWINRWSITICLSCTVWSGLFFWVSSCIGENLRFFISDIYLTWKTTSSQFNLDICRSKTKLLRLLAVSPTVQNTLNNVERRTSVVE